MLCKLTTIIRRNSNGGLVLTLSMEKGGCLWVIFSVCLFLTVCFRLQKRENRRPKKIADGSQDSRAAGKSVFFGFQDNFYDPVGLPGRLVFGVERGQGMIVGRTLNCHSGWGNFIIPGQDMHD